MGPEATTALMTAIAIGPLATGNPVRYTGLAATLALLVGVMSVAAWADAAGVRRGSAVTAGAGRLSWRAVAVVMIADQLRRVTGVPVTGQRSSAPRSPQSPAHLARVSPQRSPFWQQRSWSSCWCLRSRWPHAPGPLLAILLATAVTAAFGLAGHGVSRRQTIPAGLPVPGFLTFTPACVAGAAAARRSAC